MNRAQVDIEKDGVVRTVQSETLDPLLDLYTPSNKAHAVVGLTVGTQFDFGRVKVQAHVSYQCDQNTNTVDKAGLLAFEKAVSFMNDGLKLLTEEGTLTG